MPQDKVSTMLYVIVFIDLVGFGIIIPLLPYYVGTLNATGFYAASLMSIYSLMQLIFCPVWGWLSDRIGRKPVIIITLLGTCLSYLLYALAFIFFHNDLTILTVIFISRLVAGIMGGNITVVYAYISDIAEGNARLAAMGKIGAAFGLGFILGPAIGAILSTIGNAAPGLCAALFSLIACLLALFYISPTVTACTISTSTQCRVINRRSIGCFIACSFIYAIAFVQMESIFSLFVNKKYHLDSQEIGLIFVGLGIIIALTQGVLVAKLQKHVSEATMIIIGTLIMAISFFYIALSNNTLGMLLTMACIALAAGLVNPVLPTLLSQLANNHTQGMTQGYFQSAQSLSRVIGPLIAGGSFTVIGTNAPFYLGSAIALLSTLTFVIYFKKEQFSNLIKRRVHYVAN